MVLIGFFLFLSIIEALRRWTALPLEPRKISKQRQDLTLADQFAISNQVVDAASNINEALCLFSMLIFSYLHDKRHVFSEEVRPESVDYIKEVLPIHV